MNDPMLADKLLTPLDTFAMPVRLANVLQRRGVATLGQLVGLAPETLLLERNLGRKSVRDAAELIQDALGMTWTEARQALTGAPSEQAASDDPSRPGVPWRTAHWRRLAVRLAPVAQTPLARLEFPVRLFTFANARGVSTLGELLAIPIDELARAKNVGRTTVATTLAVLEEAAARIDESVDDGAISSVLEPTLAADAHWRQILRDGLATLEGQERIIATQRGGLAGNIPTLAELGECFGLSRERIRQLEVRGLERLRARLPRDGLCQRLEASCEAQLRLADEVAANDPLFAHSADDIPSLCFFVNDVLAGSVRAYALDDRLVLARLERAALHDLLRSARDVVRALPFPMAEPELTQTLAARLQLSATDVTTLLAVLGTPLLRDGERVVGVGSTRDAELLAFLRAAAGPVDRNELEARFGRGRWPEEFVFVERGLITLADKIDGWERWLRRLPPLARTIMEREDASRQWTTDELADLLSLECELPPWLNAWTLGSLLRQSKEVKYLGRNVVALLGVDEEREGEGDAKRIYVVPALEQILLENGGPMLESDAQTALMRLRGLAPNTWNMTRVRRPFVLLDNSQIGLYPRDVPGGAPRAERILGALYEWLSDRGRGLMPIEQVAFLDELEGLAEGYSPRTLRAVARLDGRFRLNIPGAIGLAEWGSVRALSQRETLEQLLDQQGGSVPLTLVAQRISTTSGQPLPRSQLSNLAASIGARLRGDSVVRVQEQRQAPSSLVQHVFAELPERTSSVFDEVLREVSQLPALPDPATLRRQIESWGQTLRAHAATDCPHIELEQLASIEIGAVRLIDALPSLAGDQARLATAAVVYVDRTDDAEADTAIGGLDDDEAVVRAACAALLPP